MKKKWMAYCMIIMIGAGACKKENQAIDTEYPVIDLTGATAFPKQCSNIARGQTFVFRALLTDNAELGSVSIDIHHNFDHHTHSTEVDECGLSPIKRPENPLLQIKSFPLPTGLKTYTIEQEIMVPADVDAGDYHFMIRLTDKEGWQTIRGLSIKIS